MQPAPLYDDVAAGPPGGAAHWLTTADGLRIRVGHWPLAQAKGTVLIFPGRTEFVEKYGLVAQAMQDYGYASLAIDWRGQGLAQRLARTPAVGHVRHFSDYQLDVAAVMAHAAALHLPRPYFLLAHSMGGCIGLRALIEGLDVAAAMFSAPMWGVQLAAPLRPLAWAAGALSRPLGFDQALSPGQSLESYVLREEFANNTLTNDPEIFAALQEQLIRYPALGLGGPSLGWLYAALQEMRRLSKMPAPDVPALCFLGSDEAIVHPGRIRRRMRRWPEGRLQKIKGGKHEMLLDLPEMRQKLFADTAAFFDAHLKATA